MPGNGAAEVLAWPETETLATSPHGQGEVKAVRGAGIRYTGFVKNWR